MKRHHLCSFSLPSAASCAIVVLLAGIGGPLYGSNWIASGSGDYHTAGNWSAGVPNAAGAVADFSMLDFSGEPRVTMDSPVTVGQLDFGDMDNPGSPTSWELSSNNASALTLDNSGVAPVIYVDPLGITSGGWDDTFIGVPTTSAMGLTKTGNGVLTFNAPMTISGGNYTINGGHLRFLQPATQSTALPYVMANGTTLSTPHFINEIAVSGGASVTVNMTNSTANQFMNNVHGAGTGESLIMNVSGTSDRVHSLQRDWGASNGAWANVTFNGIDGADGDPNTLPVNIRLRINTGGGNLWYPTSFTNTAVTLNNGRFFTVTNSFGNNVTFGSLSGNVDAVLAGGNAGSAVRYIIGGLNTDTTFAGLLDGTGGLSINKVGAGTLTLSGKVNAASPVLNNTDPGRQGGVVRVTSGTLATSDTFNNFASGLAAINATVDIKSGAILDVTGSSSFHSVPFQQFIGAGTIKGNFDHQAGYINPADTGVADNDTDLTNILAPTAGTITFDGNLSFNGGTIVFDIDEALSTSDLIAVTGVTDISGGGTIDARLLSGVPGPGAITLLTSDGGIVGTTDAWTLNWSAPGAAPVLAIVGNSLQLVLVPEPSSVVLACLAAVGLLSRLADRSHCVDREGDRRLVHCQDAQ